MYSIEPKIESVAIIAITQALHSMDRPPIWVSPFHLWILSATKKAALAAFLNFLCYGVVGAVGDSAGGGVGVTVAGSGPFTYVVPFLGFHV